MTLFYNFVMLAVDVLAVWLVLRHKSFLAWCNIMMSAGIAAMTLGGILGGLFEDDFGVMRFWSYGVFLHGVVLLFATGFLWWKSRRKLAVGAILGALSVILIAVYAFLIEPQWLEVNYFQITSPKIRRPLRIVILADLQTDRIGSFEAKVLRRILDENPDIIFFAGDYVQASKDEEEIQLDHLHSLLVEMRSGSHARAFAVRGNADSNAAMMTQLFAGTDTKVFDPTQSIDLPEFRLTGLFLHESFDPSLEVKNPTPDRYHIVLGHSPNFALGKIDADLLVAGHTHGGQVRIPWIGPLFVHSKVPLSWAAGLTDLPSGGKLLVSRGIGMERQYAPRLRFFCRPELVVLDLKPEEKRE